jgi:hypothetical protein
VIDETCLSGIPDAQRNARYQRIEQALGYALAQLRRCGAALGFTEVPDVISVLRRSHFFCGPGGPGAMASMTMLYPGGADHRARVSAAGAHRYEISLTVPSSKDGATAEGHQRSFMDWEAPDFAATIAHEAMHVLAMNNRSWHNSITGRPKFGCTGTVYDDRIYFTEAACFPSSMAGRVFYGENGAGRCDGVCERALTEVDPEVQAQLHPLPMPTDIGSAPTPADGGVYGPSLLASPYARTEADRICARVRSLRGVFPSQD